MNVLADLTALLTGVLPIETGVFSGVAPEEYLVITPLLDDFQLFGDDRPEYESQEARLSLFSKGNYLARKQQIVKALIQADFTITQRQYIGHEDDSGYHHWAVDILKIYPI